MAISLEELAAAALEGSVGPWTLALGAGAVAVALAAGSARPLRRMAATSLVSAAAQSKQVDPRGWLEAARRGWTSLVDEARAEYEASARPEGSAAASPIVVATAAGIVPGRAGTVVVPTASELPGPADDAAANQTRDRRGRFVRRSTNGTRPE